MASKKTASKDSTIQPRPSAQVRTRRGSTTILTQDPKVPGGTIVPNDGPYHLNTPGTVTIAGPLVLPGLSFTLHCGTLETVQDSRQRPAAIDVSGLPGTAPAPDPSRPAKSGARGEYFGENDSSDSSGGNGSQGQDGAPGGNGGNGGNIDLSVRVVEAATNLSLSANGGQGSDGQRGQSGGTGGAGAKRAEQDGRRSRGRIAFDGPGGNGGKGGNGGDGGAGGNGGTIDIACPAGSSTSFASSVQGGAGGSGAAGGEPGASGPGGGGRDDLKGAAGNAGQQGSPGRPGADGTINRIEQ